MPHAVMPHAPLSFTYTSVTLSLSLPLQVQRASLASCPYCDSNFSAYDPVGPTTSNDLILYCAVSGSIRIPRPQQACTGCGRTIPIHPCGAACFPSSPIHAATWFSTELLHLTACVRRSGAYSATSWTRAMREVRKMLVWPTSKSDIDRASFSFERRHTSTMVSTLLILC
jgi:hypothetical protein